MPQQLHLLEQPARKQVCTSADCVEADRLDPVEADLDPRDAQVIGRSIFEPGNTGRQIEAATLILGGGDC
jgi:hypothetical protein